MEPIHPEGRSEENLNILPPLGRAGLLRGSLLLRDIWEPWLISCTGACCEPGARGYTAHAVPFSAAKGIMDQRGPVPRRPLGQKSPGHCCGPMREARHLPRSETAPAQSLLFLMKPGIAGTLKLCLLGLVSWNERHGESWFL